MTIVTIDDTEIRAYNHVGKTPICIAVSAVLQTVPRILHAGFALDAFTLEEEPPRLYIKAAIGDFLPGDQPVHEQMRIARERAGRRAFVAAVFAGAKASLLEIQRLNGAQEYLEIKDVREMRDDKPTKAVSGQS